MKTTLNQYLVQSFTESFRNKFQFVNLVNQIASAAKAISKKSADVMLTNGASVSGQSNFHGEEVRNLDVFADYVLTKAVERSGACSMVASEEKDLPMSIDNDFDPKPFVVLFDPLDGSTNSLSNNAMGTIFTIYRRMDTEVYTCEMDCLQDEKEIVAAGYFLYGPSTTLVISCGQGVQMFALSSELHDFVQTHESIKMPISGNTVSVNLSYLNTFNPVISEYIMDTFDHKKSLVPTVFRYTGALVSDFHRILMNGGVFLYPATDHYPQGKLRLNYECKPLSFIARQAGGDAISGTLYTSETKSESLHQRSELVIGSVKNVGLIKAKVSTSEREVYRKVS